MVVKSGWGDYREDGQGRLLGKVTFKQKLEGRKEGCRQKSVGRASQAEGMVNAKPLRWTHA